MGSNADTSKLAREIEGQAPGVSPGQGEAESGQAGADPGPAKGAGDRSTGSKSGKTKRATRSRSELQREFAHLRDRDGLSYDPELHLWNEKADRPATTPAGVLKRKPGPRSKRRAASGGSYIPPETDAPEGAEAPVTERDLARTSAKVLASTWFSLLTLCFGKAAQPSSEHAEREQLEEAWTQYFVIRGQWNLPPSLLIGQAMGAHLARTMQAEEPRRRVASARDRLAAWWGRRRSAKAEAAAAAGESDAAAQRSRGGRRDRAA